LNRIEHYIRLLLGGLLLFLMSKQSVAQSVFYSNIAEIKIQFDTPNWRTVLDSLFENNGEEGKLVGTVIINGKTFKGAGIRHKGYSSWAKGQKKNPFNIELDYQNKHANYEGFSKIKLGNVISDPSFIREVLSYEIARKYMPAPEAFFANVYVNDTLVGLYSNVESIDELFLEKHLDLKDQILIKGNPEHLIYPFGQNSNLAYTHGDDSTGYMPYYELQSDYGWESLFNLIYTLNNDNSHLYDVLNIDQTLWMHALNYAMVNLDSYIGYSQNYYMYRDQNFLFNPLLWDLNMSFGSFRNTDGTDLNLSITEAEQIDPLQHLNKPSFSPRPLLKQLLVNSTYKNMYLAHLKTINEEIFKSSWLNQRAWEIHQQIINEVFTDTNKFYTYQNFKDNIDTTVVSGSSKFPGIKSFVQNRSYYLTSYFFGTNSPEINHINIDTRPKQGDTLWINLSSTNADSVYLYFKTNPNAIFKYISMFDDGMHHDGIASDGTYGVAIVSEKHPIDYYFYAQNDSAGVFLPQKAAHEFFRIYPTVSVGQLVINEFDIENEIANIELFNATSYEVNLNGVWLNVNNDTVLLETNNVKLKPLQFRVSEYQNQTPAESFSIRLFSDYQIIDSLIINRKLENQTIGRYPNATGRFDLMPNTIGTFNQKGTVLSITASIYPNPASNIFNVELPIFCKAYQISVSNLQGQLVWEKNFSNSTDDGFVQSIDCSTWLPGVYFVSIIEGQKIFQNKIVVNR